MSSCQHGHYTCGCYPEKWRACHRYDSEQRWVEEKIANRPSVPTRKGPLAKTSFVDHVLRDIEEETMELRDFLLKPRILGRDLEGLVQKICARLLYLSGQGWNWPAGHPKTDDFVQWLNAVGWFRTEVLDRTEIARSDLWDFRAADNDIWPHMSSITPCLEEIWEARGPDGCLLLKTFRDSLTYEGYDSSHCDLSEYSGKDEDILYEFRGDRALVLADRRAAVAEYLLARRFLRMIEKEDDFVAFLNNAMESGEHQYPELVDIENLDVPRA